MESLRRERGTQHLGEVIDRSLQGIHRSTRTMRSRSVSVTRTYLRCTVCNTRVQESRVASYAGGDDDLRVLRYVAVLVASIEEL